MPNKDGTGPEGKGSLTGRQRGKCKDAQPCTQRGTGRGRGQGNRACRGFGRKQNQSTEEKQNA